MNRAALTLGIAAMALVAGCSTPSGGADSAEPKGSERSPVTAGMVKKTIVKGKTTQAEVLEVFGPPDLLTHRDGREVWTYDKTTYEIKQSSGYFTVVVVGGGSNKVSSSSRSSMVILYFDDRDVVQDYRLSIVRY